ncbi:hypothetical protein Q1J55_25315 [Pseudomonas syringae]|uniref:hypothetical protein n=1 Tax=Pseudomonas syringae group TaxID=136849 RepID=UPI0010FAB220|nr:hypothetical protein [Pseudomonas viridiflava]
MVYGKMIYLDYNLFESYRVDDVLGLRAAIDGIKDEYTLPYSPAHLEDLASSLMWKDHEEAEISPLMELSQDRLQNIIDISKMVELLPAPGHQPTQITEEHPGECLLRVLKHFDSNRWLDVRESDLLENLKATDAGGARSKRISNLPVNFLSSTEYDSEITYKYTSDLGLMKKQRDAGLTDLKWPEISKSHEVLEHVFEVLMNYLEEIRFRPEDTKKARSRMHDVTHAIYATKADYFITGDVRFHHKVSAVYDYLQVPTKVVALSDFLEHGKQSFE